MEAWLNDLASPRGYRRVPDGRAAGCGGVRRFFRGFLGIGRLRPVRVSSACVWDTWRLAEDSPSTQGRCACEAVPMRTADTLELKAGLHYREARRKLLLLWCLPVWLEPTKEAASKKMACVGMVCWSARLSGACRGTAVLIFLGLVCTYSLCFFFEF